MTLALDKKKRKVNRLKILVQILFIIAFDFTSERGIFAKSLSDTSQEYIQLSEIKKTENANVQIKEYLVDDKENNLGG